MSFSSVSVIDTHYVCGVFIYSKIKPPAQADGEDTERSANQGIAAYIRAAMDWNIMAY